MTPMYLMTSWSLKISYEFVSFVHNDPNVPDDLVELEGLVAGNGFGGKIGVQRSLPLKLNKK
jgi:hypothetical protein